jgi:hypothetical protein
VVFLLLLGLLFAVSSEAAKIVAVEGEVLVKADGSDLWQMAVMDMVVSPQAQIQTKAAAQCSIAFDEGKSRLATVKENSSVKVDSLQPDELYLSGGRVFSLIKSDTSGKDFRVKTPTAISGARGTAWTTAFGEGKTSVQCIENVVFVAGVDAAGQMTQQMDIQPGFGVSVDEGGAVGEAFALAADQLAEGQQSKQSLESLPKTEEPALPTVVPASPAPAPVAAQSVSSEPVPQDATVPPPPAPVETDGQDMAGDVPMMPGDVSTDLSGDPGDMTGPMDNTGMTDDSFDMTRPLGDDMPPIDPATSSGGVGGGDLQDLTQQIKDDAHDQTVIDQQMPPSDDGNIEPPPPGGGGEVVVEPPPTVGNEL